MPESLFSWCLRPATLLKRDSCTGVFFVYLGWLFLQLKFFGATSLNYFINAMLLVLNLLPIEVLSAVPIISLIKAFNNFKDLQFYLLHLYVQYCDNKINNLIYSEICCHGNSSKCIINISRSMTNKLILVSISA